MKIKRFDETEYDVLVTCSPDAFGGYYYKSPHKERALLLMEEGYLEECPYDNWHIKGWSITDKGIKYWKKFIKKVRAKHGHVWKTRNENNPDDWDDDKYGKETDWFAYEAGEYHNGPVCKKCGYGFCHHCTSEFEITEKCSH